MWLQDAEEHPTPYAPQAKVRFALVFDCFSTVFRLILVHFEPQALAQHSDADVDEGAESSGAAGASGAAEEGDAEEDTALGVVVRELRVMLNIWLKNVDESATIAHVYVYGSCLLFGDMVEEESDIDLLVVVPSKVDRGLHFFGPQPEAPAQPSDAATGESSGGLGGEDAGVAVGVDETAEQDLRASDHLRGLIGLAPPPQGHGNAQ